MMKVESTEVFKTRAGIKIHPKNGAQMVIGDIVTDGVDRYNIVSVSYAKNEWFYCAEILYLNDTPRIVHRSTKAALHHSAKGTHIVPIKGNKYD